MVTICKQAIRAPMAALSAPTASKKRDFFFVLCLLFAIFAEDRRHLEHLHEYSPAIIHIANPW